MTESDRERFLQKRKFMKEKRAEYEELKKEFDELICDEKVKRFLSIKDKISESTAKDLDTDDAIDKKALDLSYATPGDIYIYLGAYTNTGSAMFEVPKGSSYAEVYKYVSIDNAYDIEYIDIEEADEFIKNYRIVNQYAVSVTYKGKPKAYYNRLKEEYIKLLIENEVDVAADIFYETFEFKNPIM